MIPATPALSDIDPAPRSPLDLPRRLRQFWNARHPRKDNLQLHHGNVYILPTRAGWVFSAVLLVLLLSSINFQLNLGYLLTFLLGGSAIVSLHMTHRTLRGLSLHLREPQPVHAGEAAVVEAVLDNADTHARPALGLRVGDKAADPAAWTWVDVPGMGSATVHLSVAADRRGRYPLPRITIHTRFPFGLFHAWSIWRPAAEVLVWPTPERPAPPLAAGPQASGNHPRSRILAGDEVDGVRDWRRGDALRLVAWKKSTRTLAATGTLVSRDRETRVQQDLWLDWTSAAPLPPEARLSRLTAWIWSADRGDLAYGLRLPGQQIEPSTGDLHRLRCLEALAMWQVRS